MSNPSNTFGEEIAKLCINQYTDKIPKQYQCQQNEWDVIAGFVLETIPKDKTESKNLLKVLTLTTGTKCLGISYISQYGNVVRDMHAEILSHRVLVRMFYQDIHTYLESYKILLSNICTIKKETIPLEGCAQFLQECLEKNKLPLECINVNGQIKLLSKYFEYNVCAKIIKYLSDNKISSIDDLTAYEDTFEDRPVYDNNNKEKSYVSLLPQNISSIQPRHDLKFHLFISQPPCGDASIYIDKDDSDFSPKECNNDSYLPFTGAKVANKNDKSKEITSSGIIGPYQRKLRIKPGRSDLPAHCTTRSYSCTDKIEKWCYKGLQGGLLSTILQKKIYISSITIGTPLKYISLLRQSMNRSFFFMNSTEKRVVGSDISVHYATENRFIHAKLELPSKDEVKQLKSSGSNGVVVCWSAEAIFGTGKSPQHLELLSGKSGLRHGVPTKGVPLIHISNTSLISPPTCSNLTTIQDDELNKKSTELYSLTHCPNIFGKQASYSKISSLAFYQVTIQLFLYLAKLNILAEVILTNHKADIITGLLQSYDNLERDRVILYLSDRLHDINTQKRHLQSLFSNVSYQQLKQPCSFIPESSVLKQWRSKDSKYSSFGIVSSADISLFKLSFGLFRICWLDSEILRLTEMCRNTINKLSTEGTMEQQQTKKQKLSDTVNR